MNRDERLLREYAKMQELAAQSALISFTARGTPPDRYTVTFRCTGLAMENGVVMRRHEHICILFLRSKFPVEEPQISWRSPIFHPNFKNMQVCLGQSWTPALSIAQLCLTLGEMIQYKNYNIDDPLDSRAAVWVQTVNDIDPSQFPVDRRSLLEPVITLELIESNVDDRLEQSASLPIEESAVDEDIILALADEP